MIYENEVNPPQARRYNHVTPDGADIAIGQASFPKPFYIGLQYGSRPLDHCPFADAHSRLP